MALVLALLGQAAPAPAITLLQRGLVALQHGQLVEAQNDLEEFSRLDPSSPFVWSSLAETYLRLNEPAKADSAASRAEKLGSSNPLVWHALAIYYLDAGHAQSALSLAQRSVDAHDSPESQDVLGRSLLALHRDAEALPHFARASQGAPTDPHIAFDYAQALLRGTNFDKAAEVASSALQAHPDDPQLTLTLGVARYGQRRFEDAVTAFLKVIAIDPRIDQPYTFLGKMLDQAGEHLPAITSAYETRAARDPENAATQLLLAEARLAADPKDPTGELLLRKSLALDPRNWEAHYQLGVLLENNHNFQAAAPELERAVELDPKQPMIHYHLARVYDRLGQPDRAKAERDLHQQLTAAQGR